MNLRIVKRLVSLLLACALLLPAAVTAGAEEADKSALQQAVDTAVTDLTPYTPESAAVYTAALEAANRVLADENADQQAVDGALADLLAAADSLIPAPVFIPGNVDGDKNVTSTDARMMLQVAVGKIERSMLPFPDAADPDGDGGTTSTDARMALQFSVGKIDLGHHLVTEPGTPATCTEEGVSDAIFCTDCDLVVSAHKPVPAGHKAVTDKGRAATCTEDGLTDGKHCSVCGLILETQRQIPAAGHTDTPLCAGCGRNNRKILMDQLKNEVNAAPDGVQGLYTHYSSGFSAMTFLNVNEEDGRLQCTYYLTNNAGTENVVLVIALYEDDSSLFDYACQLSMADGTVLVIYGEGIPAAEVNRDDLWEVGYTDSNAATQEDLSELYQIAMICLDRDLEDLMNHLEFFQSTVHVLGFVNYRL